MPVFVNGVPVEPGVLPVAPRGLLLLVSLVVAFLAQQFTLLKHVVVWVVVFRRAVKFLACFAEALVTLQLVYFLYRPLFVVVLRVVCNVLSLQVKQMPQFNYWCSR